MLTAISSISLLANAILFTIYINAQRDKTAKGIFIATLIYGITVLIYKMMCLAFLLNRICRPPPIFEPTRYMKYYIIAGEASGDLHGSNLIREIKKKDEAALVRGWGGGLMQEAGGKIVKDYRDLAFMGFTEVVRNLPTILRNIRFCKSDILAFQPDVIVFIDYPGFQPSYCGMGPENEI